MNPTSCCGFLLLFLALTWILTLKYARLCDVLAAENKRLRDLIENDGESWKDGG